MPTRQQKIWDTLNYYLSHNLIPVGFFGVYLSRIYIRYRRIMGNVVLSYPDTSYDPNITPKDAMALAIAFSFGFVMAIWFSYFRNIRNEFASVDFNQQTLESILAKFSQVCEDTENPEEEKTIQSSYGEQATILSRIGMFPSLGFCKTTSPPSAALEISLLSETDRNHRKNKITVQPVENPPYEKSQYIHVRTMLAFFSSVTISNNVTSRLSIVDTTKNIIYGL
jgi:hypothetical protein